MFKLLTGRAPFADGQHETAVAKMSAQVSTQPPSLRDYLPEAPPDLIQLIASMLAKQPQDRPQTPEAVVLKLQPFVVDADLLQLAERAKSITQAAPIPAPSIFSSAPPKSQPFFRRTVPLPKAIAAGFFGIIFGLLLGITITVKHPDGTETVTKVPDGTNVTISLNSDTARSDLSVETAKPANIAGREYRFLDLKSHFNQRLIDNLGRGREGTDLKELPTGAMMFGNMRFSVGDGFMQVGSRELTNLPEKIEGITVGYKLAKLNFFHATMFGGGPSTPESQLYVPDGTEIGEYLIHYEDKSSERIAIVYGKHVRDWYYLENAEGVTHGQIAWTGTNRNAPLYDCKVRLYAMTWENPKPTMKIVGLDFIGRKETTVSAPFCIAITAEVNPEPSRTRRN